MREIREKIRDESGSSMILALVFLMFCLFIGGSVLTAASVNAGRIPDTFQTEQDQRSGLILLQDLLEPGLQITVRDVTVQKASGERLRKVRYSAVGGGTRVEDLLYSWVVDDYGQKFGVPDVDTFRYNGKEWSRKLQNLETEGEILLELELEILPETREITGTYRISEDGSLEIRLAGPADLRLILPAGNRTDSYHSLTASGISTVTKTTVYYWESPIIEKGDLNEETP